MAAAGLAFFFEIALQAHDEFEIFGAPWQGKAAGVFNG